MPNLFKRMRKLRTLVNVRTGPGAAILPNAVTSTEEFPAVTRLHLTYAQKIYGGHQGSRHFWRRALPSLKYYNPGVPMSVRQTTEQDGPAALTVYFANAVGKAAAAANAGKSVKDVYAPPLEDGEQTVVINLKNLEIGAIWEKVKKVTGAKEVDISAEDTDELAKLEAMAADAEKDRERVSSIRQAKRDRERMLSEARAEANRLREMAD